MLKSKYAAPTGIIYLNKGTYIAIEGFVVYTGGDYGLHLNVMLLVQVMGVRAVWHVRT